MFSSILQQCDPVDIIVQATRSFQPLQNAAAACFLKDPRQMDHINVHALRLVLATRVFLEAVQRVAFDLWSCIRFKPDITYPPITHSGQDETGDRCRSCSCHNSKVVPFSVKSTKLSLPGKFSCIFSSLLTGWSNVEDKGKTLPYIIFHVFFVKSMKILWYI